MCVWKDPVRLWWLHGWITTESGWRDKRKNKQVITSLSPKPSSFKSTIFQYNCTTTRPNTPPRHLQGLWLLVGPDALRLFSRGAAPPKQTSSEITFRSSWSACSSTHPLEASLGSPSLGLLKGTRKIISAENLLGSPPLRDLGLLGYPLVLVYRSCPPDCPGPAGPCFDHQDHWLVLPSCLARAPELLKDWGVLRCQGRSSPCCPAPAPTSWSSHLRLSSSWMEVSLLARPWRTGSPDCRDLSGHLGRILVVRTSDQELKIDDLHVLHEEKPPTHHLLFRCCFGHVCDEIYVISNGLRQVLTINLDLQQGPSGGSRSHLRSLTLPLLYWRC